MHNNLFFLLFSKFLFLVIYNNNNNKLRIDKCVLYYCIIITSSLFLLLFCCFKVTTNYRVCSVAYLECKLRKIKREESIMNQFLDPIVDLRYTIHIYPLVILSFYILTYNFIYLRRVDEIKKLI